ALSYQTLAAAAAAAAALSVVGEEPRWRYSPPTSLSLFSSTSQGRHTGARSASPTHGRHAELRHDENLWRRGSPAPPWWGLMLWAAWSVLDLVEGGDVIVLDTSHDWQVHP
ncbi:unnamed protein product, partial [Urochloa humidicola]